MFIAYLLQILMIVWFLLHRRMIFSGSKSGYMGLKSKFLIPCVWYWSLGVFKGFIFFGNGWVKLVFWFFDSWAIIASKFKDKTTRQCRRRLVHINLMAYFLVLVPATFWLTVVFGLNVFMYRWFTYLNSDFKKGGWSPEEDILLCEVMIFIHFLLGTFFRVAIRSFYC